MKKDFDYVLMDDYKKDTAALIDHSQAIIYQKDREIKQLKEMLSAVIKTVGEVTVPFEILGMNNIEIIREEDHETNSIKFKAN